MEVGDTSLEYIATVVGATNGKAIVYKVRKEQGKESQGQQRRKGRVRC
jgi:hypothetical protein